MLATIILLLGQINVTGRDVIRVRNNFECREFPHYCSSKNLQSYDIAKEYCNASLDARSLLIRIASENFRGDVSTLLQQDDYNIAKEILNARTQPMRYGTTRVAAAPLQYVNQACRCPADGGNKTILVLWNFAHNHYGGELGSCNK